MKIAITGSTGQLGRLVINRLKNKVNTEDLVALARSTNKAAELGISVREADYEKPEMLESALTGIGTLLLISSNEIGRRAIQHTNVIAAAKKAHVGRIVYTSLLHADTSRLNLADEHRQTEDALRQSGVPYTLLRNGWYTENYAGSIAGAVASGAFLGSAGQGKISSAARADFADAAVVVLTEEGHVGKIYELAGDTAYTLTELAAEISRQSGKTIPYRDLPEADYAAALTTFGLPDFLARAFASWDVEASKGALFDDSRQLSKLIGHPTTPLADSVRSALAHS